jgi:hypothetical protein
VHTQEAVELLACIEPAHGTRTPAPTCALTAARARCSLLRGRHGIRASGRKEGGRRYREDGARSPSH